jgi:hypothetical protein
MAAIKAPVIKVEITLNSKAVVINSKAAVSNKAAAVNSKVAVNSKAVVINSKAAVNSKVAVNSKAVVINSKAAVSKLVDRRPRQILEMLRRSVRPPHWRLVLPQNRLRGIASRQRQPVSGSVLLARHCKKQSRSQAVPRVSCANRSPVTKPASEPAMTRRNALMIRKEVSHPPHFAPRSGH